MLHWHSLPSPFKARSKLPSTECPRSQVPQGHPSCRVLSKQRCRQCMPTSLPSTVHTCSSKNSNHMTPTQPSVKLLDSLGSCFATSSSLVVCSEQCATCCCSLQHSTVFHAAPIAFVRFCSVLQQCWPLCHSIALHLFLQQ